ncbi:MAG TPA: glycosyltransferase, partial [Thermotogota bacterium]|nr:glycosyltransferase [Thermotogota bacterium]
KNKLKKIHSKVDRYFSITPNCKTFAEKELGVPYEKHTLLLLGVDEETTYFSPEWRVKIRKRYGVQDTDLAIITIGKLDEKKKVEVLIDAIKRINNKRIKLFIVGSFQKEYEIVIDSLIGEATEFIKTGWVEQNQVFKYLSAADLAVFPGGQSVLWQQAISTGLPIILKHWQEIEYIKINDDIHFLYTSNAEELEKMIQTLYHRFIYTNTNLRLNKIGVLSYREIAHISIESVYHTSR